MTWTNPPPSLVDARDTLLQCVTVTGTVLPSLTLEQRQARCHYPQAASTDTFPLFTFRREGYGARRHDAIGYQGSGRITVNLVVDDESVDDGTLEAWAEGICNDLCSLGGAETGIQFVLDAECGEAIAPDARQLAAAVAGQPDMKGCSFRVISISWNWEG